MLCFCIWFCCVCNTGVSGISRANPLLKKIHSSNGLKKFFLSLWNFQKLFTCQTVDSQVFFWKLFIFDYKEHRVTIIWYQNQSSSMRTVRSSRLLWPIWMATATSILQDFRLIPRVVHLLWVTFWNRKFFCKKQKCPQNATFKQIGTMTDISKVKLKIKSNFNSARLFPNPEWKLISSDTSEELFTYSNTTTWSSVKFTIEIKRNSLFYVNMFVWPLVFILFVIMCIFVLPPICVERVVMGVMIILSLIIMLLCLESYTPKNSFNSWPIIG